MFTDELKFDDITIIDQSQITIDLPAIIDDATGNLRSIEINFGSLGQIFSSNETKDFQFESDKYISFYFYQSFI